MATITIVLLAITSTVSAAQTCQEGSVSSLQLDDEVSLLQTQVSAPHLGDDDTSKADATMSNRSLLSGGSVEESLRTVQKNDVAVDDTSEVLGCCRCCKPAAGGIAKKIFRFGGGLCHYKAGVARCLA